MMVLLVLSALVWLAVETGGISFDRVSFKEWSKRFNLKELKLKSRDKTGNDRRGNLDAFIAFANAIEFPPISQMSKE